MNRARDELTFIVKIVCGVLAASLLASAMLYFFMDVWIGEDYGTAFQAMAAAYEMMNYYILMAVLVQFCVSAAFVLLLALYYSHRIAGPIYKLKSAVKQYKNGEAVAGVRFRKSDFLQHLAQGFSVLFAELTRRKRLFKEMQRVLQELDSQGETGRKEAAEKIDRFLDELSQAS